MKKHLLRSCLLLFVVVCLSAAMMSCIVTSVDSLPHAIESQMFEFNSVPSGATVLYEGKTIGTTPCEATLPLNINYDNSAYKAPNKRLQESARLSSMNFIFAKEGYETETITITPTVRQTGRATYYKTLGTALLYSYDYPDGVFATLDENYEQPKTVESTNKPEQVIGDGSTSLEHTILNWEVTSRPAGADIYWRIISSTPDVKNTNKNYKSTTPYESTESFDIKGLTYANSADVQIEITCEKPGYLPQKKVYNMRAAVDQKSINAHFTLVKDE